MTRFSPELGKSTSRQGGVIATLFVVGGWSYFIITGTIQTIWPMFGIANQLLACAALCVGTTILLRESKRRVYAFVTLAPLAFVGTTTLTAGVQAIRNIYLPLMAKEATRTTGIVNVVVTSTLLVCVGLIIAGSIARWIGLVRGDRPAAAAGA
jgi:carbon starvation protein